MHRTFWQGMLIASWHLNRGLSCCSLCTAPRCFAVVKIQLERADSRQAARGYAFGRHLN